MCGSYLRTSPGNDKVMQMQNGGFFEMLSSYFSLAVTYSFVLAICALFLSFLICFLLAGSDANRIVGMGSPF
jgi:hypothetical protein